MTPRTALTALVGILLVLTGCGTGPGPAVTPSRGSLGLVFTVRDTLRNGIDPVGEPVMLAEAPGFLQLSVEMSPLEGDAGAAAAHTPVRAVTIRSILAAGAGDTLDYSQPDLTGRHYLACRWDSAEGVFETFLDGIPLRTAGNRIASWGAPEETVRVQTVAPVDSLEIDTEFWTLDTIQGKTAAFLPFHPAAGSATGEPPVFTLGGDIPYRAVRGETAWRVEGSGTVTVSDGWFTLAADSTAEAAPRFLLPAETPDNFVLACEFRPLTDDGEAAILFAVTGGEPAFKGYAATIFTGSRGQSGAALLKYPWGFLVADGPVAIPHGTRSTHRIVIEKAAQRIRVAVNGGTVLDWTDDGVRYGPVYGIGAAGFVLTPGTVVQIRNLAIRAAAE